MVEFKNELAKFVYYRTYSRYLNDLGRREDWNETVNRVVEYFKKISDSKLPKSNYEDIRKSMLNFEVMPSMRLVWTAGEALDGNSFGAYNCAQIACDRMDFFSELMFVLMHGTGVGYSVREKHINQIPAIKEESGKTVNVVIEDSKEGWAKGFRKLVSSMANGDDVTWDVSKVRPMGSPLKKFGGRASGPLPLISCIEMFERVIKRHRGRRLSAVNCHDLACKVAEIVVVGGVRRSALISLSDLHHEGMRHCKDGQFWIENPQRAMSNNSAVYEHKPTAIVFMEEWLSLAKSGSGERGIFNISNIKNMVPPRRDHTKVCATNPCLTGDTVVYTADGRKDVTIKQLADEDVDIPVFCIDHDGQVTARRMRNPRITGYEEDVYEVTLDDGLKIKATRNHKFHLRNGTECKVSELEVGDSLSITTRYEPSQPAKSSSYFNNYISISGKGVAKPEHRIIAEYHYGDVDKKHIHHVDGNKFNNSPSNLCVENPQDHLSEHSYGSNNPTHIDVSNEDLIEHGIKLCKELGYRFSAKAWGVYADKHNLPKFFSDWRNAVLGSVDEMSHECAKLAGLPNYELDPRQQRTIIGLEEQGYVVKVVNSQIEVVRTCEECKEEFQIEYRRREACFCSKDCVSMYKTGEPYVKRERIIRDTPEVSYAKRKEIVRNAQLEVFAELKNSLHKNPDKKEWVQACKDKDISFEISRKSSPFRYFSDLVEASYSFNHRVVSVKYIGKETVYNGTVDDFHNFLVGGWSAPETKGGLKRTLWLTNTQCGEIFLRESSSLCNLSEFVVRKEDTMDTLMEKIKIATIIGTLQSMLTNFGDFVSPEWKINAEEERLLGVSMTGQMDNPKILTEKNLQELRDYSIGVNTRVSRKLGINRSVSITTVKPSGTVSQLCDSSSGFHPRFSPYYLRRVRISSSDPLYKMMVNQGVKFYPEVGQAEATATTWVCEFPVAAPKGAITVDDVDAIEQLEQWRKIRSNYTEHTVSATIYVKPDEWFKVGNWVYQNFDDISGLSFLPKSDHVYELAPYHAITREDYLKYKKEEVIIDYSKLPDFESGDYGTGSSELACEGDKCQLK